MLLCKAHQCGRGLQQSRNRKFACARAGLVLDAYASCSLASLGASREYAELEVAFVGVWAEGGDPKFGGYSRTVHSECYPSAQLPRRIGWPSAADASEFRCPPPVRLSTLTAMMSRMQG